MWKWSSMSKRCWDFLVDFLLWKLSQSHQVKEAAAAANNADTVELHCLALSVTKTCGVISPVPSRTGENLMNTWASGLSYRQEASCWHASSGKLRFGIVSNDSLPRSPSIITTSSRTGSYSQSNKADYPAKCLLKVMIMIKSRMFCLVFTSDLCIMT